MNPRESWEEEQQSAYLYGILADVERSPEQAELFRKLADAARSQSQIWAQKATEYGKPVPAEYLPTQRVKTAAMLARLLGPTRILPVLAGLKVRGLSAYGSPPPGHHAMPRTVEDVGRRHGSRGGGTLRAAVFGANDGLVSNASLILGVAGADVDPKTVMLSGIAGLLAGAFSMAAGEYISVSSQRELLEHQISAEREELASYPQAEAEELALIYAARGVPQGEAHTLANRLIANPDQALETLAREELGVDPQALGSAWGAAGSSFVSFASGAVVPLLPYLFVGGTAAVGLSAGATALALVLVGITISLFTGKNAARGGLRMLLVGGIAGGATFLIGRLLGVAIAG